MDGLTSLVLVLVCAALVWLAWKRTGLAWFDFVILRVGFVYARLWHRWSCLMAEPYPSKGPVILISNPCCSADPSFLLAPSDRPISFLVAREHYNVHWFCRKILDQLCCVSVVRSGADITALRTALRRLAEGKMV